MDHEKFKDLTSGIQSIVLSLAVIVGGLWALYTFWGTKQLQKAQAEILGLQIASNRSKVELLQLERSRVAVLNLSLHVLTPLEILPSNQARLVVDVEIKNDGNEPMMVDMKNTHLR